MKSSQQTNKNETKRNEPLLGLRGPSLKGGKNGRHDRTWGVVCARQSKANEVLKVGKWGGGEKRPNGTWREKQEKKSPRKSSPIHAIFFFFFFASIFAVLDFICCWPCPGSRTVSFRPPSASLEFTHRPAIRWQPQSKPLPFWCASSFFFFLFVVVYSPVKSPQNNKIAPLVPKNSSHWHGVRY